MKVYTIGFTRKAARRFFEMLCLSGAKRVVDVRLNNVSQLAGFAKKDDLAYFLKTICDMEYVRPHHCHRRLVAEYLRSHWGDVEIIHLGSDGMRTSTRTRRRARAELQ